jgi:flavorubredoxin
MDSPKMFDPRQIAPETFLLPAYVPLPTLGVLPVNAFLIRGRQPILIDTGLPAVADRFFDALSALIDPADIEWLWLTHTDADHVGSLERVLSAAPRAKLVTTFLGMGKLSLTLAVPPERVFLLNPGQSLDAGDRKLVGLKPPTYDAPETTAVFDATSRVLFSSDSFGALLASPVESASQLEARDLREGMATWTSIDAPWLHTTEKGAFLRSLEELDALGPSAICSSHLPPATGVNDLLLASLNGARDRPPFIGPDQQAMMQMMSAA